MNASFATYRADGANKPWRVSRALFLACVCAASWVPASPVRAGPADSDVEPPARSGPATPSPRSSRGEAATPGGAVNSGSTIDLLIDLQGKAVGLEFKDKNKGATERSGPLGGTGSAEPVAKAASGGLFGAGAAGMLQPKAASSEEVNLAATRKVTAAAAAGSDEAVEAAKRNMQMQGGADSGQPGTTQVLLAWVRENRVVVILVGLVLLGLVGVASLSGGGRR
jgi:hypothetical protein